MTAPDKEYNQRKKQSSATLCLQPAGVYHNLWTIWTKNKLDLSFTLLFQKKFILLSTIDVNTDTAVLLGKLLLSITISCLS